MPEPIPRSLILQSIQKASGILDSQHLTNLHQKLSEDKSIAELFSLLVQSLLEQICAMQTKSAKTTVGKDYEALQESIQKAQQQIRKHIRIEQQMKLYSDYVQQKLETTEKKLTKLNELIEGYKFQNQQLKRRIKQFQRGRNKDSEDKSKKIFNTDHSGFNTMKKTITVTLDKSRHQRSQDYFDSLPDTQKNDKIYMLKRRKSTKGNLRKKLYRDMSIYKTIQCYESQPNSFNQQLNKKPDSNQSHIVPRKNIRCNSVCK